ncbi:sulfur carrier protein ThiS [Mesoterricola silvestris]|uniref:Thiamine biosynthesis protein ThiS n=1 Tax=Mesoterricola silvestris TaxID=2927979 RepID=A0AA48KAG6_9BACT|nr:sulfur carrier protein ThiS [Mesoterricola silvestris]BDU75034.1 thiamine biosynthesis protein ThiS [Mesoterricola silvestris]
MRLILNGRERETPELATVADLAQWLMLPGFGSAVELNGEVVRKASYGTTELRDHDRLEVVRLVGGG